MNKEARMHRYRLGLLLPVLLALGACGHEDPPIEAKAAAAKPDAPAASAAAPASPVQAAPAALGAAAPSRAMLDAWLAAWNDHDSQRLGALMTDDVEFFDAGFSGVQHGREAALDKGVWLFLRGVPDLHWELRGEPVVGKDSVAWEWTFTGTNTGTWGSVQATRQRIQLKGVGIMRLRDGKVSQVSSYYDSASLNRQLGL
jgi:steroid delta-isomerase-like uncharacterized protein